MTIESAPAKATPTLRELAARSFKPGQLLNLHGQMANSPALLAGYMAMRRSIDDHGTLDQRTRIAILVAASAVDGAEYTQALDRLIATRAGWTADDVRAMETGTFAADPKLAALLAVVREAAHHLGRVEHGTWQAALDAGWTPAQLADAFASVSLAVLVDSFAHFAGTPLDTPA